MEIITAISNELCSLFVSDYAAGQWVSNKFIETVIHLKIHFD